VTALEAGAGDRGTDLRTVELVKDGGETRVLGQERFDAPPWQWPKR
jgi:hypothetical protein